VGNILRRHGILPAPKRSEIEQRWPERHHDPEVHLAMLKNYQRYDTILMPLNPADPAYLSFEKKVAAGCRRARHADSRHESTANAGLL
jgi:gamma-glutamylcysteine synthetase